MKTRPAVLTELIAACAELKTLQQEKEVIEARSKAADQRYADALLKLDETTYKLDEVVAEAENLGRTIEDLVADGILSANNARDLREFRATRRQ